jgi:hypothetical protein
MGGSKVVQNSCSTEFWPTSAWQVLARGRGRGPVGNGIYWGFQWKRRSGLPAVA